MASRKISQEQPGQTLQADSVEVCQENPKDIISSIQKVGCIAALLLALCSCRVQAERFGLSIDEGWVMKTGDIRVWAESEFDDGAWKSIRVGSAREKAGFAEYDGYAWYRVKFVIPKGWNQDKLAQEGWDNDFLVLSLGPVDDADVTYFNGVKIGTTVTMSPEYPLSGHGVGHKHNHIKNEWMAKILGVKKPEVTRHSKEVNVEAFSVEHLSFNVFQRLSLCFGQIPDRLI